MKKLLILITIIIAVLFTACKKEPLENDISLNQYDMSLTTNSYRNDITNTSLVKQDSTESSIKRKKVINNIKKYLSTTYPDSTFGTVTKTKRGYCVKVKSADGTIIVVYFDKFGKFVKVTP